MATSKSGNKSVRQSAAKRVFNVRRLREMRRAIKGVETAKDAKEAEGLLPHAYKAIDKAAKRGVLKKNTAARKKSKLAKNVVR
tara:strand:- start:1894 stop:2142 length:249 start_codon:yes stop_codon:yes gene_type:complete